MKAEERGKVITYTAEINLIVSISFEAGRGLVSMALILAAISGNSGGVQSTVSGPTVGLQFTYCGSASLRSPSPSPDTGRPGH